MGVDQKKVQKNLAKLLPYGDVEVVFQSELKNGKTYRKLYSDVNSMFGDSKNDRLGDPIDLVTFQTSLLDGRNFVWVCCHEE